MNDTRPQATFLKDYAPPAFLIDTVKLHVSLDDNDTIVRSVLAVRRNPQAASNNAPLVLNGERMGLSLVMLDLRALSGKDFEVDDQSLTIPNVPNEFQLELVTHIDPQSNTTLEGLYKSGDMFCTQCEAQGFRRITYFLDRPDVMARYTVTIEADAGRYPVLLSNGDRIESGRRGSRHFTTWDDPYRKPSYLFALVAGRLARFEDTFTAQSGRKIALHIYVEPHNIDKCAHAGESLKQAMRWDEETFGLEYDLNTYMIVAADDFNMGAMENKGLNIFNFKYILARPETATDADYEHIQAVIGHEYFHNWTGNRVTCRDWFQLSLKEGLTVFREQAFMADMASGPVQRINDVRLLRAQQFAEDAGPMAHPVRPQSYIEINNFYTVTVYEKGAEVVRMYQTLLGREGFRRGLRLYLERHDGQAATTDDFAAAMGDANGRHFTQFRRWYDQAGTPRVYVSGAWNAAARRYRLRVEQRCAGADQLPFHIPLVIGLIGPDGDDLPLQLAGVAGTETTSRVLELTGAAHDFEFVDVPAPPVPSLLRDFSAPVVLHYDYSDDELAFLAAHDSDPFNRWEAGQRLATRLSLSLIEDYHAGKPLTLDPALIQAFERTLADAALDEGLIAEALTLPGEGYLAEQVAEIDVDAIHAARQFMRKAIATALESQLAKTYRARAASPDDYTYNAAAAARRGLRDLCLDYLNMLEEDQYAQWALDQFSAARNMTDTMGALHALNERGGARREQALQAFHDRWRGDPLVMDKWFGLQAVRAQPGTLERVERLLDHPLFSIRNPNRIRALIGSFAQRNPVNFHSSSGAGYRFLSEQVLRLDPLNPQMAARLVKSFSQWKKHEPRRRALQKAELESIAGRENVSRDVFEVVSKSLA
ncbi:MAG: aminopeptidase N [Gammaproteobacteria bacterium]